LGDEGEGTVGIGRDDDRGRQTRLELGGRRVERFAELHDVQAALAEGRTHRRRRVGLAGLDLKLDVTNYFLSHFVSPGASACCSGSPSDRENRVSRLHVLQVFQTPTAAKAAAEVPERARAFGGEPATIAGFLGPCPG